MWGASGGGARRWVWALGMGAALVGCAKQAPVEATVVVFDTPSVERFDPEIPKLDRPKAHVSFDDLAASPVEAVVVSGPRSIGGVRDPRLVVQLAADGAWTGALGEVLLNSYVGDGLARVQVLTPLAGAVAVSQSLKVDGGLELQGTVSGLLSLRTLGLFDLVLGVQGVDVQSAPVAATPQVRIEPDAMLTYRAAYTGWQAALTARREAAAATLQTFEADYDRARREYERRGGSYGYGSQGARAKEYRSEVIEAYQSGLRRIDKALEEAVPPDQLVQRAIDKLSERTVEQYTATLNVELVQSGTAAVLWRGTVRAQADKPLAALERCAQWVVAHTPRS